MPPLDTQHTSGATPLIPTTAIARTSVGLTTTRALSRMELASRETLVIWAVVMPMA
jgi:hypothetical protein